MDGAKDVVAVAALLPDWVGFASHFADQTQFVGFVGLSAGAHEDVEIEDNDVSDEAHNDADVDQGGGVRRAILRAPNRLRGSGQSTKRLRVMKWHRHFLTVQKDSGRKNTLTKVNNLMFSPSRVAARLSMTALALKSFKKNQQSPLGKVDQLTPSLSATVVVRLS